MACLSPTPSSATWPVDMMPIDLTIEIAYLSMFSLRDFINFTNICRGFRELRKERATWLAVLLNEQERHFPLACPIGTELHKLSFDSLVDIGFRTHRLSCNWSKNNPSFVQKSSKKVAYAPLQFPPLTATIVSVIPGTPLIVLYLEKPSLFLFEIRLYNIETLSLLFHQRFAGRIIKSSYYDYCGRHVLAVATFRDHISFQLQVFSIDYRTCSDLLFESVQLILNAIRPLSAKIDDFFIYKDLIGILMRGPNGLCLDVTNLASGQRSGLILNGINSSLTNQSCVTCSIAGNKVFFILIQPNGSSYVFHCPSAVLYYDEFTRPDDVQAANLERIASVKLDPPPGCYRTVVLDFKITHYGLQWLEISHSLVRNNNIAAIGVKSCTFPPDGCSVLKQSGSDNVDTLYLPGAVASQRCNFGATWLVAASHSGLYKVLIRCADDGFSLALVLLRFHHEEPGRPPSAHRLRIPDGLRLDHVYSMVVDERRGVVYLSLLTGSLVALAYV